MGLTNVLQFIGRPDSGLMGARSALARNQADIINAEGQMLHLREGLAKIDETWPSSKRARANWPQRSARRLRI
jgi:hypothetical protein